MKSKIMRGGGSNVSKPHTCPSNKFSFFNSCISWNVFLVVLLAFIVIILLGMVINQNKDMSITMIENDISNTAGMYKQSRDISNTAGMYKQSRDISNTEGMYKQSRDISNTAGMYKQFPNNTSTSDTNSQDSNKLQRVGERFQPNDLEYSKNTGTGTPTSERIHYDVNVNIRDVDSYRQNPNVISYGRYEAEKNMERIINPLLPPERSYVNTYGIPINIPSRGPLQAYQQVGILYKENIENPDKLPGNNNESNILPLFGRPTYSGSNRWNYYTSSDKFQTVKLPILLEGRRCTDDLGCNELRNGDMVVIPSYNGRFRVEIYDWDKPRYIPFVY